MTLRKSRHLLQANFFIVILLTDHAVFLLQLGINFHLRVLQKAKTTLGLVQFRVKLTRAN